jgi:hemerythrin superfamily protein
MPAQKLNDAIKLLTQDHKEVDALFKRYDKLAQANGPAAQKADLAHQICTMLTVHATIEEEIFYPAARAALKEQDLLDEAEVEHASAKELIGQIEGASPDSELYDAKVKVLGEYIRHHVKEEQDEMFPKLRRTELDLVLVGEALAARKQELMGATMPA